MKKELFLFLMLPFLLFISAVVTGIYLEMLQLGITLTVISGMLPVIGSSILEQRGNFKKENTSN